MALLLSWAYYHIPAVRPGGFIGCMFPLVSRSSGLRMSSSSLAILCRRVSLRRRIHGDLYDRFNALLSSSGTRLIVLSGSSAVSSISLGLRSWLTLCTADAYAS
ncbi:hypothetical protein PIB30_104611 [Stylosanthes scabra]|uniref:Secreted protein n=1 Tax=Stylosanthes scabra TaxID=79078 RepID=A0ABU6UX83_9FABA|nr:hypothetical protein [Stylosanthes scabra]